jgi:hypothetical protein
MITALVLAARGPEALAFTLSALVPGVVDGLVGDAVVLTRRADPDVAAVAEATGAALVTIAAGEDPWRAGAARARRAWVLCLEDGDVPAEGWVRTLDRFVSRGAGERRFGRLTRRPAPLGARVSDLLGAGFGTRRVRAGDLVHRTVFEEDGLRATRPVRIVAEIGRDPAFR